MTRRSFSLLPFAAPLLPTKSELDGYIVKLEKRLPGGDFAPADQVVAQAQGVWLRARMLRWGRASKAEAGYKRLREVFWDAKHGGFVWEVDAQGKPSKTNKHLYGQAFGLLAAAEYAMASRKKDALEFALRLFELLEKRSHDPVHGGYVEYFLADWSTPPVNEPTYLVDSAPGMKTMQTHLLLLEAMTTLYQATRNVAVRERLIELIAIETNAVVRKQSGLCTDKYDRDWTPRLEGNAAAVGYGQDLENIWAVVEAARVAGVAYSPYVDGFRQSFASCVKRGIGAETPAWLQAEAAVCALTMYQLTSGTEYFEVFRKIQVGQATEFHQGRAVAECILRLRAIREKTS